MLCADQVPIKNMHFKVRWPKRFSRSPERPYLHYVVMSSPIPSKLQTPSSLPGLTSLSHLASRNHPVALLMPQEGRRPQHQSRHFRTFEGCPLYPWKRTCAVQL